MDEAEVQGFLEDAVGDGDPARSRDGGGGRRAAPQGGPPQRAVHGVGQGEAV